MRLELQLGRKTSDHLLALCAIVVIVNNIQIQDCIYDQAPVPLFAIKNWALDLTRHDLLN